MNEKKEIKFDNTTPEPGGIAERKKKKLPEAPTIEIVSESPVYVGDDEVSFHIKFSDMMVNGSVFKLAGINKNKLVYKKGGK